MSQRLRRCRAAASPALMHGMCPDRAEMKLGRREASAQRITNHVQVAMIVTTTMLATLCQVRKSQLGGPVRGAQGCMHHVRRGSLLRLRFYRTVAHRSVVHKDVPQGTDMLALAAATHGQDPAQTLIILAAVAAAIFWRALLKIALALIVILFVVLLSRGVSVCLHDLRLVVP